MTLKEMLNNLNNNYTDEEYNNYYCAIKDYLTELWKLLSKNDKSNEELKRIEFIKSELEFIEKNDNISIYPYFFFVKNIGEFLNEFIGAGSIDELKQSGIDLNDGFIIQVCDTISAVTIDDFEYCIFIDFFKSMLEGKPLIVKTKNNNNFPDNADTYSIDYKKEDIVTPIMMDMIKRYGDKDRGEKIISILENGYPVDYSYIYMLLDYRKNGKVEKEDVLSFLVQKELDVEAIKKYVKYDFTDEELLYYFHKIRTKYQNDIFKEMINKLYGNPTKFLGVKVFGSIKNLFASSQKEDLTILDILRKKGMISFCDNGIENYGISNEKEATKGSIEEILRITKSFFKTIDDSGALEKRLFDLLSDEKIVFYTPEQKKEIETKYNVNLSSSCYVPKNGIIFVEYSGTYNSYVVLVHEMMHLISYEKNEKINKQIQEFPSIYFEYQAEKYAEQMGIVANESKNRIDNSKTLYETLKLLASINIKDFSNDQGNIDYENLKNYLVEKGGSLDYIDDFIIKCYQVLENRSSTVCFSYVFSSALTDYCVKNSINPSEILNICHRLSEFRDVNELLNEFNIELGNDSTIKK